MNTGPASPDDNDSLLRQESFNSSASPSGHSQAVPFFQSQSSSNISCWRKCIDVTVEMCSLTAVVRVIFLVFLGISVACLSTISGYVALKSAPTRLSAEESSATTVGSWFIWMSMTIVMTLISVFLASNYIYPLDDRRDAEGTGQTMYERWAQKSRLFCSRHGGAGVLTLLDSITDTFVDEADTSSQGLMTDSSGQHREAVRAVAAVAAERAAEDAANQRDRQSGLFGASALEERTKFRQQISDIKREQIRHADRAVVGTGLPEVRAVLSGGDIHSILSFRQAFMRFVALLSTMSAGFLVGGEGPFVLISASIAHSLSRLPPFRWFLQSSTQARQQLLSTAAAVGIAAVFGAPFGGLLFSIEVTSTFYPMHSYFSSFVASFSAALAFICLWNSTFNRPFLSLLLQTSLPEVLEATFYQLFYFVLLGVICALLGLIFNKTHGAIVRVQQRTRALVIRRLSQRVQPPVVDAAAHSLTEDQIDASDDGTDEPAGCCEPLLVYLAESRISNLLLSNYFWSLLVAVALAFVSFPGLIGNFMAKPSLNVMQDLWSQLPLDDKSMQSSQWGSGSTLYINLIVFFCYRFFFTAASLAIPLPGGILIPAMVIGASVGRLIGELMGLGAVSYGAGVFAVVGAAGFCSAVTQSLSLIIIVFELTGQLFFLAPLIVTVVTAVLLSSRLGPSIYEQMVSQQPHLAQAFLPQIPRWASRGKVRDIIQTRIMALPERAHLGAINALLLSHPNETNFPVVSVAADRQLLGVVSRDSLQALLKRELIKRFPEHEHTANRQRRLSRLVNSTSVSIAAPAPSTNLDEIEISAPAAASASSNALADLGDEAVDLQSAYGDELCEIFVGIPFEALPVRLLLDTSLVHVHMLFISLQLQQAYVTEFGQLVGRVTRTSLCQTFSISQYTPSQRKVFELASQAQAKQESTALRTRARRRSRAQSTSSADGGRISISIGPVATNYRPPQLRSTESGSSDTAAPQSSA